MGARGAVDRLESHESLRRRRRHASCCLLCSVGPRGGHDGNEDTAMKTYLPMLALVALFGEACAMTPRPALERAMATEIAQAGAHAPLVRPLPPPAPAATPAPPAP